MLYEDEESDRIDEDAAWYIWMAFATLAVARSLSRDGVDFHKIAGERKQIPIIIGSGDADSYIGMITPHGWKPDFS